MTDTAIVATETARISKLLRLIFGSEHPGEIVAAVTATKRALAAGDRDTHFIAEVFERGATLPVTRADDHDQVDDDDGRPAIWFCWHRRHRLSEKERAFIERIRTWRGPLSEKQRIWLRDICDRLEAA